jgi:hypothetical protein
MGLMIEVHRKMHEIIVEASDKEAKRTKKEMEYGKKLSEMEDAIHQVSDAKSFLEQHSIAL